VTIVFRRREIAKGEVTFVGELGKQQRWGKVTIGAGKALVEIRQILCGEAKPPMRYIDIEDDHHDWPKNVTLAQLWDRKKDDSPLEVGVNVSNLHVNQLEGGGIAIEFPPDQSDFLLVYSDTFLGDDEEVGASPDNAL